MAATIDHVVALHTSRLGVREGNSDHQQDQYCGRCSRSRRKDPCHTYVVRFSELVSCSGYCGGVWRTLYLFASLLTVGLFVPSAGAAALGLANDDGFVDSGAAAWTDAASLRVSLVRIDIFWPLVAATPPAKPRVPKSSGYDWTTIDARVRAVPVGTQILLTLGGTPEWARADGGAGGSPNDPAWMPRRNSWKNFAYAAALRYNGLYDPDGSGPLVALPRVLQFEIWPYPNLARTLRPQRLAGRVVAPGLYKNIFTAAAGEITKVASAAGFAPTIITGGIARTDPAQATDTAALTFLRGMARTRLKPSAIGLRLSPQTGIEGPADASNLSITDSAMIVNAVDTYWPSANTGVWLTGYVAPSGPATSGITPETQAAAVQAFLATTINPRFAAVVWDALKDTTVVPNAGLCSAATANLPCTAKPAWTVWIAALPPA